MPADVHERGLAPDIANMAVVCPLGGIALRVGDLLDRRQDVFAHIPELADKPELGDKIRNIVQERVDTAQEFADLGLPRERAIDKAFGSLAVRDGTGQIDRNPPLDQTPAAFLK